MSEKPETTQSKKEPDDEALAAKVPEKAVKDKLVSELEKSLAEKNGQIENLNKTINGFKENADRLNTSLESTVSSYRNMVLKAHPGLPEELVSGKNIEEIDASLDKAKSIVTRVKKSVADETKTDTVPVGAPARSRDTTAGLSPRDKIQYAIGGNS